MNNEDLKQMIIDLDSHCRGKNELLQEYVQGRLNKSLESYYDDLTSSYEYLSNRNTLKLLNRMNKEK